MQFGQDATDLKGPIDRNCGQTLWKFAIPLRISLYQFGLRRGEVEAWHSSHGMGALRGQQRLCRMGELGLRRHPAMAGHCTAAASLARYAMLNSAAIIRKVCMDQFLAVLIGKDMLQQTCPACYNNVRQSIYGRLSPNWLLTRAKYSTAGLSGSIVV